MTRAKILESLCGMADNNDSICHIITNDETLPEFYIAYYNHEIVGYTHAAGEYHKDIHYSGNAYWVTGRLAQQKGWKVIEVPRG